MIRTTSSKNNFPRKQADHMRLRGLTALACGALLFLGASRLLISAAAEGDRIPIRGLQSNGEGIAAWNTGAGAPEPEMSGHQTVWTACSAFAPYYLASRDVSMVDLEDSVGLRASPTIDGLPDFVTALSVNGLSVSDVTMSFGLQTLGPDREGHEWTYDPATMVEQRYYSGGEFSLALKGEPLIGGSMPRTTLTFAYKTLSDCTDDEISGKTETVLPENRSADSSPAAQAVATALLSDLAGNGLRFVYETVRRVDEPFTAAGRTVGIFEVQAGQIEVANGCSCAIGIFEADDTHAWDLMWVDPELPAGEPVRLKVVATTLDPQESAGSSIVVTVFDESAPMSGVVLDVSHPDMEGDAEGWLDLEILPNTRYSFTVRHTGAARHYKLGTSHSQLRLGQSGLRYLRGEKQSWAIEVAANETVQLEVSTDAANLSEGADQATRATLVVEDAATGTPEEPPDRPLIPGSSQVFTFVNGPSDRRLVVHLEADGHIRLAKVGGDEHLYALPCFTQDQSSLVVTITDAGVDVTQLRVSTGQRVEIVNNSSRVHQIQSNPHPFHTNCPPLNQPGLLAPGTSGFTGVFAQAGSCGFHDHLSPTDSTLQGQIVIDAAPGGTDPGDGGYALAGR